MTESTDVIIMTDEKKAVMDVEMTVKKLNTALGKARALGLKIELEPVDSGLYASDFTISEAVTVRVYRRISVLGGKDL